MATYIADRYPICCLILISPFTSIKDVVNNLFGPIGSVLVKQRFENLKKIEHVRCPTLLIHGKKDDVIPSLHSEALYSKSCKFELILDAARCHCHLVLPENMTHSEIYYEQHLIDPILKFFDSFGLKLSRK